MAFQLTTGDIEAEIDIRKGASLSEAVSQALDNKAVRELIGQTVEKYARDVFDNDGEPSSDWLEKCAQAFILGGRDAVEDHIRASFEHPSAVDHAAEEARGDPAIEELVDDLVDGLRGVRREKSSAIRDAIWARMDEVLEEELAAKDTSVPLDAIGKNDHVRLTYVPGMNGLSPEDVMIKAVDRVCSAETVILDERLIPLFVMANVDRDAFVDFVREDKGIDLTQAGFDESWSDYRRAEEEARAASWRDATWTTDPDKPELVSKEDLFLILGESSYGGVPSLTISVPLKQFIERDWSLPLVIEPATIRDSGKMRTVAGQLGLHDFVWGSGYTITNSSPITIPPDSLKDWCVSEKTGHGFDKVYDMVGWAYRAGVKDGEPAPEAELQAPTP
ncbi:hypothetical protein [Bosea sp. ANAM02]|uniref:hypothetical protein n=1 Tax=Bosea sp. ANAM02 TaxID=2020412 RepID=UPI00140F08FE|nr:hypothetical protein [Bosea sp. ANAM02]BCB21920.1 hypothetical protein OCUBac02_48140 [Bosea sp. ANAM02]